VFNKFISLNVTDRHAAKIIPIELARTLRS